MAQGCEPQTVGRFILFETIIVKIGLIFIPHIYRIINGKQPLITAYLAANFQPSMDIDNIPLYCIGSNPDFWIIGPDTISATGSIIVFHNVVPPNYLFYIKRADQNWNRKIKKADMDPLGDNDWLFIWNCNISFWLFPIRQR